MFWVPKPRNYAKAFTFASCVPCHAMPFQAMPSHTPRSPFLPTFFHPVLLQDAEDYIVVLHTLGEAVEILSTLQKAIPAAPLATDSVPLEKIRSFNATPPSSTTTSLSKFFGPMFLSSSSSITEDSMQQEEAADPSSSGDPGRMGCAALYKQTQTRCAGLIQVLCCVLCRAHSGPLLRAQEVRLPQHLAPQPQFLGLGPAMGNALLLEFHQGSTTPVSRGRLGNLTSAQLSSPHCTPLHPTPPNPTSPHHTPPHPTPGQCKTLRMVAVGRLAHMHC